MTRRTDLRTERFSRVARSQPGIAVDRNAAVWQHDWFMTKELRTQSLLLT